MFLNKSNKTRLLFSAATVALMMGAGVVTTTQTAKAQDYTTGMVQGLVQDVAGTVLSGATVVLKSNSGVSRTITTGADGSFRMPRLPIGEYTMTVTKPGYGTLVDQKVMVSVGASSQPILTMRADNSDVEEIYVVGTRVKGWDFSNTETGISVNVDEISSQVPLERSAQGIALLAPSTYQGVGNANFRSLASFSGSSVAENVYYVNGMNITDFRKMTGSSSVPFDFYQAVEVKTGGYQAEFGRSTGGVMNTVTKSGSNDFHFGANLYWTPDWGYGKGKTIKNSWNEFDKDSSTRYNIWASGALVEDKLFFYGMYQWNKAQSVDYSSTTKTTYKNSSPFWGTKIDFEPFEGHRLEMTMFSDSYETAYIDQNMAGSQTINFDGKNYSVPIDGHTDLEDPDTLLRGDQNPYGYYGGGITKIFRYTGVMTDWFTLSALYGKNPQSSGSTDDVSPLKYILDCTGGGCSYLGQSAPVSRVTLGSDDRELFRVDADLYFDFYGEHHVRVGVDREKLVSQSETVRSGGSSVYYYSCTSTGGCRGIPQGDIYATEYTSSSGGTFNTIQTAQYIQDSWQVNEDLNVTLGLRNETFDNRNSLNQTFVKMSNQIAPRLGFTYDPTGDGTQRVFGSAGRYFLPVAANTNVRNAGAEFYYYEYQFLDQDNPWNPTTGLPNYDADRAGALESSAYVNKAGQTVTSYARLRDDGTIPNPLTKAQQGLKPQFMDEVILGYEYNFDNGWRVSTNLMHRKLQSMIEDIGVNTGLALWGLANGKDADLAMSLLDVTTNGQTRYIIANPGTDLTYQEDFYTTHDDNPDNDDETELVTISKEDLGYPKGKRNYTALEVQFDREWDGEWMVQGSYTMSFLKGNYEGSVNSDIGQEDPGLTRDFDLPGNMIGAYGNLANDRRHKFKLRGAYQVFDYLTVGGNFTLTSPRKFGCRGNLPGDYDLLGGWDYHGQDGAEYWFCDGQESPRGSGKKGDWIHQFDLSFSLTPAFNKDIPGDVTFQFNIFNLFNTQGVQELDMWKEADRNSLDNPIQQNYWYGAPTGLQGRRYVRFSAKYKF